MPPLYEKCCFCFSHQTGCKIIAVCFILGDIWGIVDGFLYQSIEETALTAAKIVSGVAGIVIYTILLGGAFKKKEKLLIPSIIFIPIQMILDPLIISFSFSRIEEMSFDVVLAICTVVAIPLFSVLGWVEILMFRQELLGE